MVIDNGHSFRPIIRPPKNDTPLVVDSNGMEAGAIAPERLQAVAGRHGKVPDRASLVHLNELSQRNPGDCCKPAAAS